MITSDVKATNIHLQKTAKKKDQLISTNNYWQVQLKIQRIKTHNFKLDKK